MMTREEIAGLVNAGPGQKLEFIKGLPSDEQEKKSLAKIMAAFANTNDGIILAGVDAAAREIIGLGMHPDFAKEIMNIDKDHCSPSVMPEAVIEKIDGIEVGVINITGGSQRPYYADGDCYIRRDKKAYPASHGEILEMYKKKDAVKSEKGDKWPVEGAAYEDLDAEATEAYIKKAQEKAPAKTKNRKEEFLKAAGILAETAGVLTPTAGGLLMFGKDPQHFLHSSGVRIARFKGKDTGCIIIDQKEIKGTIPRMIDEAAQFIVKHMDMGATIEGMKRSDFSEYPLVAVREAITNAIVHRDYTVDSSQTRIFIFDDRIEVYTPGGLSTGVTIDNIEYTQYSRNRAITNILMDMGQYIEKLGTGIRRMKQAIKQSGLKEPRFFDTGIDFIVTLFGPADKEWQVKKQERIEKIQQTMAVTKTPQEIVRLTNKRERQKHRRNDTMLEALIRRVSEKKPLVQMISAAVILIILATTVIISHVRRNNPVIQYRNASLLHHDKQYDRAIRGYKDFLKRFPYDKKAADAQYYIAACFEILGDNINALKSYDALLKKYPSSPWAIYARHAKGLMYSKLGQFDDAINEYQKILSEYPDHLLAQSALKEIAICYQKQGKFEEAVGQYEKSLELKSFSSDGYEHYQMALCYSELKQTEKAKEMLQKVISNEEAKPEITKEAKLKLKELGG